MKPNLKVTFHWEYQDEKGRWHKTRPKACHSYVRAMTDFLYSMLGDLSMPATPDTANAPNSTHPADFHVNAAIATVTFGIVVGTDDTAVTIADYALITKIAEGAGGGQLNYAATTLTAPVTVATTRKFTISRTMANNSGGDITVKEVAIYVNGAGSGYFCLERTLSTHVIANTASATAVYTIGVTV